MKKAIVIGASSGIGHELAKILGSHDYEVGVVARRGDLLEALCKSMPLRTYKKIVDVGNANNARIAIEELIQEMGYVDLVVIAAGTGFINQELDWDKEKQTIDVNVAGFCAVATVAMRHFLKKQRGHLVAISSIAALRGNDDAPAYCASKAFVSNYLEGLRKKVTKAKLPITITDIQPGFVATAMAKATKLFWVSTPQKAAQQIYQSIQAKKKHAYISRRWRLIAWLYKVLPSWLYNKI
jgi:short-subunit dehydrogenase